MSDDAKGPDVSATVDAEARAVFHRLFGELRPKLHRYCARMTGSVIDGEDVVQDAIVKAIEALPKMEMIANSEGWLLRIAHNAALDFLRQRARQEAIRSDEDPDTSVDPASAVDHRQTAAVSMRTFMRLPAVQRSSVILMDVLGYSLEEIGVITESSIPAVKAALHRGRRRLREIAEEPEDRRVPALAEPERSLLTAYVERFNARDFDAVRDMLADEVRLDLVARTRMKGRSEVATYFHNYAHVHDWHFSPGLADGRPALLVYDPREPAAPVRYFVILEWVGGSVASIRDFRHARYAIEGAELAYLDTAARSF